LERSGKQIARDLDIGLGTVKSHVKARSPGVAPVPARRSWSWRLNVESSPPDRQASPLVYCYRMNSTQQFHTASSTQAYLDRIPAELQRYAADYTALASQAGIRSEQIVSYDGTGSVSVHGISPSAPEDCDVSGTLHEQFFRTIHVLHH
jgi:hypothetical protein